ncbi:MULTISPECIES: TRIC cation channel family protein [unclassified Mesorhizobium]|uniref:TRIC cation channel family protein n=1 Tax=unclassified Mesorhizobium TaxID=325217 RepID=UPI001FF00958|nr:MULTISPECIES: TRIC cation channel family protein [unclassified Mesorhizobium]
MAALLGMLTGIGGGMTRDVLLVEIPQVLRSDLDAVAALAGAAIIVGGDMMGISYGISAVTGGVLCFCLRFMAIRRLAPAGRESLCSRPGGCRCFR